MYGNRNYKRMNNTNQRGMGQGMRRGMGQMGQGMRRGMNQMGQGMRRGMNQMGQGMRSMGRRMRPETKKGYAMYFILFLIIAGVVGFGFYTKWTFKIPKEEEETTTGTDDTKTDTTGTDDTKTDDTKTDDTKTGTTGTDDTKTGGTGTGGTGTGGTGTGTCNDFTKQSDCPTTCEWDSINNKCLPKIGDCYELTSNKDCDVYNGVHNCLWIDSTNSEAGFCRTKACVDHTENECTDSVCQWYSGSNKCLAKDLTCTELTNDTDCISKGCEWGDNKCLPKITNCNELKNSTNCNDYTSSKNCLWTDYVSTKGECNGGPIECDEDDSLPTGAICKVPTGTGTGGTGTGGTGTGNVVSAGNVVDSGDSGDSNVVDSGGGSGGDSYEAFIDENDGKCFGPKCENNNCNSWQTTVYEKENKIQLIDETMNENEIKIGNYVMCNVNGEWVAKVGDEEIKSGVIAGDGSIPCDYEMGSTWYKNGLICSEPEFIGGGYKQVRSSIQGVSNKIGDSNGGDSNGGDSNGVSNGGDSNGVGNDVSWVGIARYNQDDLIEDLTKVKGHIELDPSVAKDLEKATEICSEIPGCNSLEQKDDGYISLKTGEKVANTTAGQNCILKKSGGCAENPCLTDPRSAEKSTENCKDGFYGDNCLEPFVYSSDTEGEKYTDCENNKEWKKWNYLFNKPSQWKEDTEKFINEQTYYCAIDKDKPISKMNDVCTWYKNNPPDGLWGKNREYFLCNNKCYKQENEQTIENYIISQNEGLGGNTNEKLECINKPAYKLGYSGDLGSLGSFKCSDTPYGNEITCQSDEISIEDYLGKITNKNSNQKRMIGSLKLPGDNKLDGKVCQNNNGTWGFTELTGGSNWELCDKPSGTTPNLQNCPLEFGGINSYRKSLNPSSTCTYTDVDYKLGHNYDPPGDVKWYVTIPDTGDDADDPNGKLKKIAQDRCNLYQNCIGVAKEGSNYLLKKIEGQNKSITGQTSWLKDENCKISSCKQLCNSIEDCESFTTKHGFPAPDLTKLQEICVDENDVNSDNFWFRSEKGEGLGNCGTAGWTTQFHFKAFTDKQDGTICFCVDTIPYYSYVNAGDSSGCSGGCGNGAYETRFKFWAYTEPRIGTVPFSIKLLVAGAKNTIIEGDNGGGKVFYAYPGDYSKTVGEITLPFCSLNYTDSFMYDAASTSFRRIKMKTYPPTCLCPLDAVMSKGNDFYFFKGPFYKVYDNAADPKTLSETKKITDKWNIAKDEKGNHATGATQTNVDKWENAVSDGFDAVIYYGSWPSGGSINFFKGNKYWAFKAGDDSYYWGLGNSIQTSWGNTTDLPNPGKLNKFGNKIFSDTGVEDTGEGWDAITTDDGTNSYFKGNKYWITKSNKTTTGPFSIIEKWGPKTYKQFGDTANIDLKCTNNNSSSDCDGDCLWLPKAAGCVPWKTSADNVCQIINMKGSNKEDCILFGKQTGKCWYDTSDGMCKPSDGGGQSGDKCYYGSQSKCNANSGCTWLSGTGCVSKTSDCRIVNTTGTGYRKTDCGQLGTASSRVDGKCVYNDTTEKCGNSGTFTDKAVPELSGGLPNLAEQGGWDAVVFAGGTTYFFFKGGLCWKTESKKISPGYPMKINEKFPGVCGTCTDEIKNDKLSNYTT